MQQWEFCSVWWKTIIYFIDGRHEEERGLAEALSKLGREGWELVSVEPGYDRDGTPGHSTFYLKRPIQ